MYALGLIDQKQYVSVTRSGSREIFANSKFVTYLLEQGALVKKTNAEPGDTAIYFQDSTPTHAGIVANNKQLISKWGTGHLYMHAVFEVPAKYGDTIRYYRSLPEKEALRHFSEYAK
jgi:cell wall-associated NlpC family hydrolase